MIALSQRQIEPVYRKSDTFQEADDWDIHQQINMTPEERQEVADELRRRVYGDHPPDVREGRLGSL